MKRGFRTTNLHGERDHLKADQNEQEHNQNVMASKFWDTRGILLIDYYLDKGKTNSSKYYNALLDKLDAVKNIDKEKNMFLQDNAPAHKSQMLK